MSTNTAKSYKALKRAPENANTQAGKVVSAPGAFGNVVYGSNRYTACQLYPKPIERGLGFAIMIPGTEAHGGVWSELNRLRKRVSELSDEVARLRKLAEPEESSAEPGLTYDQAKSAALEMVRERGELRYSDLVFELGLSIDEAVHVFDGLEEEGYVREKPAASQD